MYKLEITTFGQHGVERKTVLEFVHHYDAYDAFNAMKRAEAPCQIRLFESSQLMAKADNA